MQISKLKTIVLQKMLLRKWKDSYRLKATCKQDVSDKGSLSSLYKDISRTLRRESKKIWAKGLNKKKSMQTLNSSQ